MISIHTPAKGVTVAKQANLLSKEISIHTPAKGVTSLVPVFAAYSRFQSTHPRRV